MAQSTSRLIIVAQPKALHRERYICETARALNRAQRFVRADDNPEQFEYPTIEIPQEWLGARHLPLYVRLTLLTLSKSNTAVRFVHPYPIDTEAMNVIKDPANNSLYFPILPEEIQSRRKQFQFTQNKLTQHQLRSHGPLKYLDSDEKDVLGVDDWTDARKIIEWYQLGQSQLLFSLADFRGNPPIAVIYGQSSVYSHVMTASNGSLLDDETPPRYAPRRGSAQGGDEILLVIPKIDKRKAFTVRFEHLRFGSFTLTPLEFVDSKTLSFVTPPCPVALSTEQPTVEVSIVVVQSDVELVRVIFLYHSFDRCLTCNSKPPKTNSPNSNKRPLFDFDETDAPQYLPVRKVEPDLVPAEGFIDQVRSSASRTHPDSFALLEDAIRRGDSKTALRSIQQQPRLLEESNRDGDTPLLLAARFNRRAVIGSILRTRPELVEQVDRRANNLLHLLAAHSNEEGMATIEAINTVVNSDVRRRLMVSANLGGQTPLQVAESHDRWHYIDRITSELTISNAR